MRSLAHSALDDSRRLAAENRSVDSNDPHRCDRVPELFTCGLGNWRSSKKAARPNWRNHRSCVVLLYVGVARNFALKRNRPDGIRGRFMEKRRGGKCFSQNRSRRSPGMVLWKRKPP